MLLFLKGVGGGSVYVLGGGCSFGGKGIVLRKGIVKSLNDFWESSSLFQIEFSRILPFPPRS